ncbi:MAG: GTPase Era [Gammaproteobacteria bacterium]
MPSNKTVCGFVTLVGRPNVGKSSLLNRLVNEKISIISSKPQTTRHQIQGVKTMDTIQIVYVDTPGIHHEAKRALNRYMNKAAKTSMTDVDVVLFVVEALKWTQEDQYVLELVKTVSQPVILVVNQIDKVHDKSRLLPYLERITAQHHFTSVIPVSALKGIQLDALETAMLPLLPESPFFYEPHEKTNQSFQFQLSELVREQLMRQLNQEVPYATTVEIEKVEKLEDASAGIGSTEMDCQVAEANTSEAPAVKSRKDRWQVHALIWVEKQSQKVIIIGDKGERLKSIGRQARFAMNSKFDCRVDLRLWVKVKEGWSDNINLLPQLGYYAE